jgi:hypothetical protein
LKDKVEKKEKRSDGKMPDQHSSVILLQRISVLEKLTAKLMIENDELSEKVAALENKEVPFSENSKLRDIRSDVESTLNEVMKSYDVTKLESQASAAAAAAASAQAGSADITGSFDGINQMSKDKTDESEMISLMTGDLICLRHDGSGDQFKNLS